MDRTAGHRKRCRRWDIPWDCHYLTFSCFRRQRFFDKDRPCRWFAEAVEQARQRQGFDVWAYVIMPEHVHLLLWPHAGVRISDILKSVKQPVAQRAIAWVQTHSPSFLGRMLDVQPDGHRAHRFWQRGGGYDRNMRSIRDTHEKADYIHNNPVRRGLVIRPEDWPWSSARAWITGVDQPIRIDRGSFPVRELTKPWEH